MVKDSVRLIQEDLSQIEIKGRSNYPETDSKSQMVKDSVRLIHEVLLMR